MDFSIVWPCFNNICKRNICINKPSFSNSTVYFSDNLSLWKYLLKYRKELCLVCFTILIYTGMFSRRVFVPSKLHRGSNTILEIEGSVPILQCSGNMFSWKDKLLCLKSFKSRCLLGRNLKEEFVLQLVSPRHEILILPDHKQLFSL